jgi:hypothetical protein
MNTSDNEVVQENEQFDNPQTEKFHGTFKQATKSRPQTSIYEKCLQNQTAFDDLEMQAPEITRKHRLDG